MLALYVQKRLLPEEIQAASARRVRQGFEDLLRSNKRKQLSAELELKLHALYFDRLESSHVEPAIHAIMRHLPTLNDVRFLLAHAPAILPEEPAAIDGPTVRSTLEQVRDELIQERRNALAQLERALASQYPDQEPTDVAQAANTLAKELPNTAQLQSIAADIPSLCPVEFHAFHPARVARAFQAMQAEMGVV